MGYTITGHAALKKFQEAHGLPDAWLSTLKNQWPHNFDAMASEHVFMVCEQEKIVFTEEFDDLGVLAPGALMKLTDEEIQKLAKEGKKMPSAPYTILYDDAAIDKLVYEGWCGKQKATWLKENRPPGYCYNLTPKSFTVWCVDQKLPKLMFNKTPGFVSLAIESIKTLKFEAGSVSPAEPKPSEADDDVSELEIAGSEDVEKGLEKVIAGPAMALLTGEAPKVQLKPAKPVASDYPIVPPEKMKTTAIVALKVAHGLYAPVAGSDHTSRYFLVADFGELKIGARIKNLKLSLRCEGNNLKKNVNLMQSIGFTFGGNSNYASVHLGLTETGLSPVVDAKRALAAVVAGIDLPLLHDPADLSVIEGQGS